MVPCLREICYNTHMELYELGVREAQEGIAKGEFSCVELTQAVIDRRKAADGEVGAYLTFDEEQALALAKENPKSVPIAIKDLINVRGQPCTCASKILKGYVSPYDATVIANLRAGGFIPAGRVHALGKGLMVAEIQQTSDCTYRLYDYGRRDADGHLRQLHTDEALDAIDFAAVRGHANTRYQPQRNQTVSLAHCPYFSTRLIDFDAPMRKNLEDTDCFVVYFCVDGIAAVKALDTLVPMHAGECILVPAAADRVELFPEGPAKLLEVTIDTTDWADAPNHSSDLLAHFIG